jgi:5-(carboxyamino)imidazole ribonucleotide synthase
VKRVILPGATIGVLGSGQLGRMFAIAARRMGYRVHTLSPDDDTPTGQVADHEIQAAYEDVDAVRAFARAVDVITFEFENIPAATVEEAARHVPVRPDGSVLYTTQHRLREKNFLSGAGFPVVPYRAVTSPAELTDALGEIGLPAVLKTAGWGYDGKGQSKILSPLDAAAAWKALGTSEAVVEKLVDFQCEISVVAARSLDGHLADYGAIANSHVHHILDVSSAPADVPAHVAREAVAMARAVLSKLNVVGVLCVEFFLTRQGGLLINELAPRPHNSGHLTFDACVTSQFEQQLRAICGLSLGSTELLRPAAMANLLGDLWETGPPNWAAACRFEQVKVHLYGKEVPRVGRKMGHLTTLAASAREAVDIVLQARKALSERNPPIERI